MKAKDKNPKKVLYQTFRYRHCDDLARLLEAMAMKGWHFTQWKLGLEFQKGQPQRVRYRVEVFPDASNYDYLPEQEALEYGEYCRAAGWTLVDGKGKFCIFRQELPDAPEIVTEEERLSNIKKAEYSRILLMTATYFLFLLLTVNLVFQKTDSLYELLFEEYLVLSAFVLLCSLAWIVEFFVLVFRFRKQKQLIQQGIRPFYGTHNPFFKYLRQNTGFANALFYMTFILVLFLLPVFLIVIFCFYRFMEWKRPARVDLSLYRVAAFLLAFFIMLFVSSAIHRDPESPAESRTLAESFPLQKEDYASAKDPVVYSRFEKHYGIMGMQRFYVLDYGTVSQSEISEEEETHTSDHIRYRIYETRRPWLLDKMWEIQTRDLNDPTDCTEEWNCQKALHARPGCHYYYIRYPGKMIILDSLQPLTPEQMETAAGKLSAA